MTNEIFEEVEVLESIYEGGIEILQPTIEEKKEDIILNLLIKMKANTLDEAVVKILVSLKIFSTYPESVPEIKIENLSGKNLKIQESEFEDLFELVTEHAEEMKGSPMIFNLIMVAQDFIDGLDDFLIVVNTIETLPEDLLVKIFNYIPNEFYQKLSRVCRRWNELVISERSLWSDLWIGDSYTHKNYFYRSSHRRSSGFKFQSINILMDWKISQNNSRGSIAMLDDIFSRTNLIADEFSDLENLSLTRKKNTQYDYSTSQTNFMKLMKALDYSFSKGLKSLSLESVFQFNVNKILQRMAKDRFVSLRCVNVKLSDQVVDNLLNPENLETLELSTCGLSLISDVIFRLPNLKNLVLNNNPIKTLPVELFLSESIELIDLNNTSIYYIEPLTNNEMMPHNNKLIKLLISDSKLAVWPPILCRLLKLETLDLSNNLLEKIPNEIIYYEKMRHFNISSNRLTEFPIENVLTSWPDIRYLNIRNNCISDIHVSNNIHTSLTIFEVQQNKISHFPLFYFTNARLLKNKYFNISNNHVQNFDDSKKYGYLFQNYPINFQEMNFNGNKLSKIPKILQHTKKLKELKLCNNNLQNTINEYKTTDEEYRQFTSAQGIIRLRIARKTNTKKQQSKTKNNQTNKTNSNSRKKKKKKRSIFIADIKKSKVIDESEKIKEIEKVNIKKGINVNKDQKLVPKHILSNQTFYNTEAIFLNLSATLITLDLSGNRIKIFPKEVLLLHKLKNLYFSNNNLLYLPFEFLEIFHDKLEIIDFSRNKMKRIPFSNGNLFLVTSKFLTTIENPFTLFTKLKSISFTGNKIPSEKYMKFISFFKNSKVLNISDN
ncbi:hypothetical protein M0813_14043 [Anaeramoeba flamelloides]|uniref:F-box domain-containing protein n=1 Tax=Anaeramoeba flamelloides TaxID=1746091 RepID=A0ABQ8Z6J6_9EUKA|nr:hypothetical protein M0813_14043 [Anaeramoeba flamelloides]